MSKSHLGFGLLVIALAIAAFWQGRIIQQLRGENDRLRSETVDLAALRQEHEQLQNERIDPADLKRHQDNLSELLRLRGQVGQLRRELQEAKAAVSAAARSGAQSSPPAATTNNSPVEAFSASATATVGKRQAMVVGGVDVALGQAGVCLSRTFGGPG